MGPFARGALPCYSFSSRRARSSLLRPGLGAACRRFCLDSRFPSGALPCGIEKSLEGISEESYAVDDELFGDFLHGDAGLGEIFHVASGSGDVFGEAGAELAVIAEGVEGCGGNGVHRVRADEFLDVEDVAVLGILGAGAGPEEALSLRALRGESFPAGAAKEFLILLVGKLGVGDGYGAVEAFEKNFGVTGSSFQQGVNLGVNEGVNAADEEAGDTGDVVDRLALGGTGFESGDE